MPKNPRVEPKIVNINCTILQWKLKEKSGIVNEAIAVTAITIIKIGLTILASTADCPIKIAPTIPIVGPIAEGTRNPASRINSNDTLIIRTSDKIGKGISFLADIIENRSSVGKVSK